MPSNLSVEEINAATLAMHAGDVRASAMVMPQESAAFLLELLFALPIQSTTINGEKYFYCNGKIPNDQAIDLVQAIIGPAKIHKPIRCALLQPRGSVWQPISLRKRVKRTVMREFWA